MVCGIFLMTVLVTFASYFCISDMLQLKGFEALSCSQKQNITILAHRISSGLLDHFLHYFDSLTQNEDCFMINVYLRRYGFSVQWRTNFNINHLENNFFGVYKEYKIDTSTYIPGSESVNFLTRLYDEELMGNDKNIIFSKVVDDPSKAYL